MIKGDDEDFIANIGGMRLTSTPNQRIGYPEDIIRIHPSMSRRDTYSIFYASEIDDLITALLYWRDHLRGNPFE